METQVQMNNHLVHEHGKASRVNDWSPSYKFTTHS